MLSRNSAVVPRLSSHGPLGIVAVRAPACPIAVVRFLNPSVLEGSACRRHMSLELGSGRRSIAI